VKEIVLEVAEALMSVVGIAARRKGVLPEVCY